MNQTPKVNERITAAELLVIDETGKNLGILARTAALELARQRHLDLIEVATGDPAARKPAVVRIFSFDKYRYQLEKKLKKQRVSQRSQALKQIQISARAARNDLEIKAKKLNQFLEEGHPVEIFLVLRGREKGRRDWAMGKLREFLTMITPQHRAFADPKFGSRGITLQIVKS